MFISLFNTLKSTGVPCTLRELLDLVSAVEKKLAFANMQDFYYLSRAALVKDEKHYDKFDRAFDIYFKNPDYLSMITKTFGKETAQHISKMSKHKLKRKHNFEEVKY